MPGPFDDVESSFGEPGVPAFTKDQQRRDFIDQTGQIVAAQVDLAVGEVSADVTEAYEDAGPQVQELAAAQAEAEYKATLEAGTPTFGESVQDSMYWGTLTGMLLNVSTRKEDPNWVHTQEMREQEAAEGLWADAKMQDYLAGARSEEDYAQRRGDVLQHMEFQRKASNATGSDQWATVAGGIVGGFVDPAAVIATLGVGVAVRAAGVGVATTRGAAIGRAAVEGAVGNAALEATLQSALYGNIDLDDVVSQGITGAVFGAGLGGVFYRGAPDTPKAVDDLLDQLDAEASGLHAQKVQQAAQEADAVRAEAVRTGKDTAAAADAVKNANRAPEVDPDAPPTSNVFNAYDRVDNPDFVPPKDPVHMGLRVSEAEARILDAAEKWDETPVPELVRPQSRVQAYYDARAQKLGGVGAKMLENIDSVALLLSQSKNKMVRYIGAHLVENPTGLGPRGENVAKTFDRVHQELRTDMTLVLKKGLAQYIQGADKLKWAVGGAQDLEQQFSRLVQEERLRARAAHFQGVPHTPTTDVNVRVAAEQLDKWFARIQDLHKTAGTEVADNIGSSPAVGHIPYRPNGEFLGHKIATAPEEAAGYVELLRQEYDAQITKPQVALLREQREPLLEARTEELKRRVVEYQDQLVKQEDPRRLIDEARGRERDVDARRAELTDQIKAIEAASKPKALDISAIKAANTTNGVLAADTAAEAIVNNVGDALSNNRTVTLYVDGKPVKITSISRGMMQDNKGQRWGTLRLLTAVDETDRLEIGASLDKGVYKEQLKQLKQSRSEFIKQKEGLTKLRRDIPVEAKKRLDLVRMQLARAEQDLGKVVTDPDGWFNGEVSKLEKQLSKKVHEMVSTYVTKTLQTGEQRVRTSELHTIDLVEKLINENFVGQLVDVDGELAKKIRDQLADRALDRTRREMNLLRTTQVNGKTLTLMDMYHTDVFAMVNKEAHVNAGEVALARQGWSSTEYIEATVNAAQKTGATTEEVQMIRDTFDAMRGNMVTPQHSAIYEGIFNMTYAAKMGGQFFTTMSEWSTAFSMMSLGELARAMGRGVHEIVTGKAFFDGTGKATELYKELASVLPGILGQDYRLMQAKTFDTVTGAEVNASTRMWSRATKRAAQMTSALSGANLASRLSHRALVPVFADKLVRSITGAGDDHITPARLADLGIQGDRQARIKAQIEKYSPNREQGGPLNMHLWDDQYSADVLVGAVQRAVGQLFNKRMVGEQVPWANTQLGRIFGQFRTFGITAAEKSTARNYGFGDGGTASALLLAPAWGAMLYYARLHSQSIGMSESEKEEFMKKRTESMMLATGIMNMMSMSGIASDITGAAALAMGHPIRSGGPASIGWITDATKATNTLGRATLGRLIADDEDAPPPGLEEVTKSLLRAAPGGNTVVGFSIRNATKE